MTGSLRESLAAVIDAFRTKSRGLGRKSRIYDFYEETNELKVAVRRKRLSSIFATPEAARSAAFAWRYLPMGALTVRRKVLERIMPIPEVWFSRRQSNPDGVNGYGGARTRNASFLLSPSVHNLYAKLTQMMRGRCAESANDRSNALLLTQC